MPQEDPYTRAIAGIHLKNNIRSFFNSMPLVVLDYIKQCCIEALDCPDPAPSVRRTVGTVITAIVTRGQAHNWVEILHVLVAKLDSTDPVVVEVREKRGFFLSNLTGLVRDFISCNKQMAFDTLGKICEDAARDLDQEMDGIRPLNFMIPKFIRFFYNPDPKLRVLAIAAASQFVTLRSQALMCNMEAYLQGLFARATDPSPEVRQEICRSLVMVLEVRPDKLEPSMSAVIDYMIYCTQDTNEQIALEACDFWIQFANISDIVDRLIPFLDRIVPALLRRMVYSEADLLMLGGDEDDTHVPDNEQDIRPRFYRSKSRSMSHSLAANSSREKENDDGSKNNDDDEDAESEDGEDLDDDEFYSEWTLRKCSAAALDVLSMTYKGRVVSALLPLLNHNLFSQDWKERESGILALGAAAEGERI